MRFHPSRHSFLSDKERLFSIINPMTKVRIYKPSRSSMTSGLSKTKSWILEYAPSTKRTPEPLMGWSQSDDTLNQVRLKFPTKEAAIAHATQQGWDYNVAADKTRIVKPRNYMDNFKYREVSEEA